MNNIFTYINADFDPLTNPEQIIKNKFDNIINKDLYKNLNTYETLMIKMKDIFNDSTKTYVNISSDRTISASTLSAINKYIDEKYKVIYIDSTPDLNLLNYHSDKFSNKEYRNSVVSNLLSLHSERTKINDEENLKRSYTKHSIDYNFSQFIFLGLNNLSEFEESILLNENCEYYKLENINKNLEKILDKIVYDNQDEKCIIIFDLSVCNMNIAPCIIRDDINNKKGINLDQLNMIINKLQNLKKIKMIDITGHYLCVKDTEPSYRITIETIIKIYSGLLKLKEYSLNIFNENSKFLIYKPLDEITNSNTEYDQEYDSYGWYILRNLNIQMRNEILEELIDDSIIIMEIPMKYLSSNDKENDIIENDIIEIMIASTNMNEQNQKSFYLTKSYKDMVLYPDEKASMLFELINVE